MAAKTKNDAPANESREQRIKRLRGLAETKNVRAVYWPGKAAERRPGDELIGILDDIRETEKRAYRSQEKVPVTVATIVRSDDRKAVMVEVSGSIKRQFAELGAELGDELLFLFRGKVEDVNEVGVELVTKHVTRDA